MFDAIGNVPSWAGAKCLGTPIDMWFPSRGPGNGSTKAARALCSGCPRRVECLEYGIATNSWGIWGGFVLHEGRANGRARAELGKFQLQQKEIVK